MPKVKITIRTTEQIPARRRAGLVIMPGIANEFDVTDEQLETLQTDALLDITVLDEVDNPTDDAAGNVSDKNDAASESEADAAADEGGEQGEAPASEAEGEGEAAADVPAIPTTESGIKKQPRHVVVEQAKSLGIELDFDNEVTVTKTVIAKAIIAKQKEA